MAEAKVRDALTAGCKERGWPCWKLETANRRGLTDWLVLVEFPVFAFVELKDEGASPTPVQEYIHGLLKRRGFPVSVAVGVEGVDRLLAGLAARRNAAAVYGTDVTPSLTWSVADILQGIHEDHPLDAPVRKARKRLRS